MDYDTYLRQSPVDNSALVQLRGKWQLMSANKQMFVDYIAAYQQLETYERFRAMELAQEALFDSSRQAAACAQYGRYLMLRDIIGELSHILKD